MRRRRLWMVLSISSGLLCAMVLLHWAQAQSPQPGKPADPRPETSPTTRPASPPPDPFAGLPPMKARGDEVQFRFRPGPKPPGTVSKRVKIPFPSPNQRKRSKVAPRAPKVGPLQVVRMAPQGKMRGVQNITVSFNQPMIAVSSLEQVRKSQIPVIIKPSIPGKFRWLGTRTIVFEPKGRIPYSTRFQVKIPKGTKSVQGGVLRESREFTFTTPRLRWVRRLPSSYSPVERDQWMAIEFNQKVNLPSLQSHLRLRSNTITIPLRIIPPKVWKKDKKIFPRIRYWNQQRTVVMRAVRPLPLDTRFVLSVLRGTKSDEGPLRSDVTIRYHFSTYGPLRLTRHRCTSYYRFAFFFKRCRPRTSIYIQFNNYLASNQPIHKLIVVRPKREGTVIRASSRWISIRNPDGFPAGRPLTVAVSKDLKDRYGQKLGQDRRLKFPMGDASPYIQMPENGWATLEHKESQSVPIMLRNIFNVRVRLIPVNMRNLYKAITLVRTATTYKFRSRDPVSFYGLKPEIDRQEQFNANAIRNKEWTYQLSLQKLLAGKPGWVLVVLSTQDLQAQSRYAVPHRAGLIRVTNLGLTARYGPNRIVPLLTRLSNGKPVQGARLSLYTLHHARNSQHKLWDGQTLPNGTSVAPGRNSHTQVGPYLLVASHQGDKTFLQIDAGGHGAVGYLSTYSRYGRKLPRYQPQYHIFTDRSPHKPGETVHIRGILRHREDRPKGGLLKRKMLQGEFAYTIRSPRYRIVKRGKLKIQPGGTFGLSYKLPEDADLGSYRFHAWLDKNKRAYQIHHNFQVLAYRAPEYKVSVRTKRSGPFYYKENLEATIEGRYTFGAAMKGAKVHWLFRRYQANFRPPNQPAGMRFGIQRYAYGGWGYGGYRRGYGHYYRRRHQPSKLLASGTSNLNAQGQLEIKVPLKPGDLKGPGRFVLEARVIDKNRQSISNRKTVIAHASSIYLGVKPNKPLIQAGKKITVAMLAVDPKGQRQKGIEILLEALRRVEQRKAVKQNGVWRFQYKTQEVPVSKCKQMSKDTMVRCRLLLPKAGTYILRATAKDPQGRHTETRTWVYAYGKGYSPSKNPDQVDLIADKQSYQPGQTARLLVNAPFRQSYGLLTIERNGIAEHSVISLKGSSRSITIPIRSEYLPNFYVSVALVRGRVPLSALGLKDVKDASDLGRPAVATGRTQIKVKLTEKQLRVHVEPSAKQIRPGSKLKLKLRATDHRGKIVPAVFTVALVDEGVLSLLGFQTPDPLKQLYPSRPYWTVLRSQRTSLIAQDPKKFKKKPPRVMRNRRLYEQRKSPRRVLAPPPAPALKDKEKPTETSAEAVPVVRQSKSIVLFGAAKKTAAFITRGRAEDDGIRPGSGGLSRQQGPSMKVRTRFAATAFYRGMVTTDRNGEAHLSIDMPDNLTTFRVMVVAVDLENDDRFGHGEEQVVVRKPLLLRPALPRFANYGDSFEASVVVNNETGKDGMAAVLIRGVNIHLGKVRKKNIFVPAGQAREVRFPVKIADTGTARLQFAAVLNGETDAVERSFPVLVPATAEAFATYGTTTSSVAQEISPPKQVLPQFGGLKISLSSTALNGLEDAARYLVSYPFECNEQTASRLMPIVALRKILPEFKIGKVSDPKKMKMLAKTLLSKLVRAQRSDGGWGFWGGSPRSYMWLSSYVMYALLRAQKAGYAVEKTTLQRGLQFLQYRVRYPLYWEKKDYTSQTFGQWVLSWNKQQQTAQTDRLYGLRDKLPMFAKAWLMAVIHRQDPKDPRVKKLLRYLKNNVTETADRAHFVEASTESLRMLMHSNDRSDAIIMQTFLDVRPQDPLIPKLTKGLMRSRIRGRWSTTQANAFAMLAMDQYFRLYESVVPNYTVQHWLGDGYLGGVTMKGRSLSIQEQAIPMHFLQKQGKQPLLLAKQGKGRLYYRIGLRYAPSQLRLKATSEGFTVARTYEPVEGKDTVVQRADGSWQFRAGSYVRVALTITVPARRFYAAVVDPLPAGLEAVNLGLKTSARSHLQSRIRRRVYSSRSYYSLYAFNHKEKRDSMVVLFADRLPAGVYEYSYMARATTIGKFIVPPTRAEEMYSPETFGRSSTLFAEVLPPLDTK